MVYRAVKHKQQSDELNVLKSNSVTVFFYSCQSLSTDLTQYLESQPQVYLTKGYVAYINCALDWVGFGSIVV